MKRIWVYDLEVFRELFSATFIDKDSDDIRVFVIYKNRDERTQLLRFLQNEVEGLIGYNCNSYDYQILEYLFAYPACTTHQLRVYSDRITSVNQGMMDVPESRFRIPHLDLFHALSLSVKAKRVGLKWTEFMIDFHNIEDMPDTYLNSDFLEATLAYNKNDVEATKALYHKYYHEIDLRKQLTQSEGINLMNSTEPNMAKKIFGKHLSEAMGISMYELSNMRTERDNVIFKDIILPYVKFESEKLKMSLKRFIEGDYISFKESSGFSIDYGGITHNIGIGGLHSFGKPNVHRSTDTHVIKSVDVKSYYPNLIIRNKFCPEHLPKDIFLQIYEGYYNDRIKIPKSDPRNYIYKIILNSTYGLTNDLYSFLRDLKVTMQVTINGQLLLLMLAEQLLTIPESKLLMCNTGHTRCYKTSLYAGTP